MLRRGLPRPDVVIFSDEAIKYESQDTIGWYRARVSGIPDIRKPYSAITGYPRRRVLTTRRDGHMSMRVSADGRYLVRTERDTGGHFLPFQPTGLGIPLPSSSSTAVGLGPLTNYLGRN